jgi:hypothetical protein
MNTQKAPNVNVYPALIRALLMMIAIMIGVMFSVSSAEAATRFNNKKSAYKVAQKKRNRNLSCETLMAKHRNSSNITVKVARRPKWR